MVLYVFVLAVTGVFCQGRRRVAIAGWVLPATVVITAGEVPLSLGATLVGLVFGGSTAVAWIGVLPAPPRVLISQAAGSGVSLGLLVALSHLAASRIALAGPVVFAVVITGMEMLSARESPFGEWGLLAHSQTGQPWARRIGARSPYAVTFAVTFISSAMGFAWTEQAPSALALALAGAVALVWLSWRSSGGRPAAPGLGLTVAGIVEHHTGLFEKAVPEFIAGNMASDASWAAFRASSAHNMQELTNQTQAAIVNGADLVVWAEGAGLVSSTDYAEALQQISAIAMSGRKHILAAWLILDRPDGLMENLCTMISPEGKVIATVHKQHPVPGPEAINTRRVLSPVEVVSTSLGRVGILICFDADHPRPWKTLREGSPDIVAIPASDWPAIGRLHADMARLRTCSTGSVLIRPARGGISTITARDGRTLAEVDHSNSPDSNLTAYV